MKRFPQFAAATLLALLLAACTAPTHQPENGSASAPELASAPAPAPAGQQNAPDASKPRPARPPRMSTPLPPRRVPDAPAVVDSSCRTDADCAVKDVGNCCGYYPACVNKDSPTDPQGVKAQCAKQGMASVCGFREVSACSCNAGKCEAAGAGGPVAQ